jgi:GT2 family glycosyltransferase
MMRVAAFSEVGGFRPALIAGEEPELCLRLRQRGWKILRRDDDMVRHDADMTSFAQWWRRCLRAGWAYAEAAAMHGASPARHCIRDNLRILFWGGALPVGALLLAWRSAAVSLGLLVAAYVALGVRIYARAVRGGMTPRDARLQGIFMVLAKFPQVMGQAQFVVMRVLGRRRRVVDWRVVG